MNIALSLQDNYVFVIFSSVGCEISSQSHNRNLSHEKKPDDILYDIYERWSILCAIMKEEKTRQQISRSDLIVSCFSGWFSFLNWFCWFGSLVW